MTLEVLGDGDGDGSNLFEIRPQIRIKRRYKITQNLIKGQDVGPLDSYGTRPALSLMFSTQNDGEHADIGLTLFQEAN
jgi:hypothetical protein